MPKGFYSELLFVIYAYRFPLCGDSLAFCIIKLSACALHPSGCILLLHSRYLTHSNWSRPISECCYVHSSQIFLWCFETNETSSRDERIPWGSPAYSRHCTDSTWCVRCRVLMPGSRVWCCDGIVQWRHMPFRPPQLSGNNIDQCSTNICARGPLLASKNYRETSHRCGLK